jgi:hypothetical protein
MWQFRAPEKFRKLLDDLPDNERKAIDQIILDLGDSSDPRSLADENGNSETWKSLHT